MHIQPTSCLTKLQMLVGCIIFNRMAFGVTRKLWIKALLFFFVAGLCGLQVRGATNNGPQFETPPPKPGSLQWENLQRSAKQRQELYRTRVFIPDAFSTNVPVAYGANFLGNPPAAAPAKPAAASSGKFNEIFLSVMVFIFIGILVVRNFLPESFTGLNRRFNPWFPAPAAGKTPSSVRSEEEAFAKFLATFRVGPTLSPAFDSVEKRGMVEQFYARAKRLLGTQRKLLQDIVRESNASARQKKLADLHSEMSALKGEAGFPEALPVWQLASALEGLLEQLAGTNATPSTLRAVTDGVDLLEDLCLSELDPGLLTARPPRFLVVDDDLVSRQAVFVAIKKAFTQPDMAVDGETALAQIRRQAYDVIFLDVQLPGVDGFELCVKIRETALNRTTPVVFVTIQSDFEARAKSALSGGNDLFGKPFLSFEITVKALTLVLRSRLQAPGQKPESREEKSMAIFADPLRSPANFIPAMRPSSSTVLTPEADDLIGAFLSRASKKLGGLQTLCREMLQATNEEARQNLLVETFLQINSLVFGNDVRIIHPAYQTCVTLEGLLKKILEAPKNSTPSALATVADAVNLLGDLCRPGLRADLAVNPPLNLLVVDDDLVSRRVIVGALQTVFPRPENVEDGEAALVLAREKAFDVIFLDVIMPGMDGFEVCSKIRETVPNQSTPVVFVTASNEARLRDRINLVGGDDLLGKPFLTPEIILKTLAFALRSRLEQINVRQVV